MDKIFPRNEHTVERALRVILGLAVLSLAFIGPKTPWAYLGVVPLLTGALGSCPLYTLFGLSTCSVSQKKLA
ncbi:MAG: DUF2892 domain-containing protein [Polyangiaceae bacterium]|jgi:hypothetical protein|nr:DUF2892 domain-containing protein [Polyangiaceae bacterium]MBK8939173.1 DUF2892 domain-containing protein [Polyangiaceae bacterium]